MSIYRNNPFLDKTAESYFIAVYEDEYESYIPASIIQSLIRYKDEHIPTGGFLQAVLENNLKDAVLLADAYSLYALPFIVKWCKYNLPDTSWGNTKRYFEWVSGATELKPKS